MAETKEITVRFAFRSGFKNSYSSAELDIAEKVAIAPGENVAKVRKLRTQRLMRIVKQDVADFVRHNDKPKE